VKPKAVSSAVLLFAFYKGARVRLEPRDAGSGVLYCHGDRTAPARIPRVDLRATDADFGLGASMRYAQILANSYISLDPATGRITEIAGATSVRGLIGGEEAIDKKRKSHPRTRRTTTKSVLRLPDLEHAKAAVLNSLTSPDAQRGYRHAIDEFVDWYCSEPRLAFNRNVVLRYRARTWNLVS
jgi:hypothetical protein